MCPPPCPQLRRQPEEGRFQFQPSFDRQIVAAFHGAQATGDRQWRLLRDGASQRLRARHQRFGRHDLVHQTHAEGLFCADHISRE